jgi:hypothetical protein
MYYFVIEGTINPKDPAESLLLAKKYLRKRGHESGYFSKIIDRRLDDLGVETKPKKSTTTTSSSKSSDVNSPISVAAFNKLCERVEKLSNPSGSSAPHDVSVDARYLPTNSQPDDWYKRVTATINEHERKNRVMLSEFGKMLEGMKNAAQYKPPQADGGAQSQSGPVTSGASYRGPKQQSNGKSKPFDRSKGKRSAGGQRKSVKSGKTVINFYGTSDMVRPDDTEDDEEDTPQVENVSDESQE